MAVGTKEKVYVGQLTEKQQQIMLAAQKLTQGGKAVTPRALANKIPGTTELAMASAISSLTKRGAWCWDEEGQLLPAAQLPILGWPEGVAGPTRGGVVSTTPARGRQTAAAGDVAQEERDFILTFGKLIAELPFETRMRIKEEVRALEDAVMREQ